MKIITVSGRHSGIGKTALAEHILKQLSGWSAMKVTVTRTGSCPRGEKNCNVCGRQKEPFTLISGKKIINQKNKDTGRMKKAGAKKVLWLKATPGGLKSGLKKAFEKLEKSPGVVIEGTSVLKYLKPDMCFFIY